MLQMYLSLLHWLVTTIVDLGAKHTLYTKVALVPLYKLLTGRLSAMPVNGLSKKN